MRLWASKCMRCHGKIGLGDGPDGASVGVVNLSDSNWQRAVADDRIAKSIRQGRGRMPAFALDEPTLAALVALIRQMGLHQEQPAEAPQSDEPPPATPRAGP